MSTKRSFWITRGWSTSAGAVMALVAFAACSGGGAVPPSLIGVIEPKPEPTDGSGGGQDPGIDVSGLYTGPADVAKYVAKFIDDAKIQGRDVVPEMSNPKLEIRIGSLDSYGSSVIGLCETSSSRRRVTFDSDFWNSVSETQRELLAHHEMGHCVLYRGHRSTVLASGIYASLMYPIIMKSSTYTSNYDYYQNELFTYAAEQALPDSDPSRMTVHICDKNELGGIAAEGGAE